MRKILFLLLVMFTFSGAFSQILNIESVRKADDTLRWSGSTNLAFTYDKNANTSYTVSNNSRIQHQKRKHLFIFLGHFQVKKVNQSNISNKAIAHLRYNNKINRILAWEVFTQVQYDEISKINFRGLAGTGPRISLLNKSSDYRFYLGLLTMYEQEINKIKQERIIQKNIRNSSYISFKLFPSKTLSIANTTYYQPLYTNFSDYRISSELVMSLKIIKKFGFKFIINYLYDSKPVVGIPEQQIKIINGFSYTF